MKHDFRGKAPPCASIFSLKNEPGRGSIAIRRLGSFGWFVLHYLGRFRGTTESIAGRKAALHWPPFPCHSQVFGTARSGQGRAVCARRRKIFSAFEKIFWSAPLRARTVPQHRTEGKGGGGLRGPPLAGSGAAPRHLTARGFCARHQESARYCFSILHSFPQALLLCLKPPNSFCLAFCISCAASMSVLAHARRSSISMLIPSLRSRAKSGNRRKFSHGVAYHG